jgi:hypothetical protein
MLPGIYVMNLLLPHKVTRARESPKPENRAQMHDAITQRVCDLYILPAGFTYKLLPYDARSEHARRSI